MNPNNPIPYTITPEGQVAAKRLVLPADYTRCFGLLGDHSTEADCPRRFGCARFLRRDESPPGPVSFGLCAPEHDFFIKAFSDAKQE